MLKAVLRGEVRERKKDMKKRKKIEKIVCLSNRTRLEEKSMRYLEEKRLRSENAGVDSIFEDEDNGSVTLIEILKDEVTFRV